MNHTIDVYTELVEDVKNGIRILRGKVGLVGSPQRILYPRDWERGIIGDPTFILSIR